MLSEADWQQRVMDYAVLRYWRVCHHRPARTDRGWRTPMQGHAGLPDLILARGGHVLLAELKTEKGKPTPEQAAWLTCLGEHGRLWRPSDWDIIVKELR